MKKRIRSVHLQRRNFCEQTGLADEIVRLVLFLIESVSDIEYIQKERNEWIIYVFIHLGVICLKISSREETKWNPRLCFLTHFLVNAIPRSYLFIYNRYTSIGIFFIFRKWWGNPLCDRETLECERAQIFILRVQSLTFLPGTRSTWFVFTLSFSISDINEPFWDRF